MSDISCKFYLRKNDMRGIYILHQLSWDHNLAPGVVFAVHKYECLMENKNIIRTFYGCKSKKKTLSLIKILLALIKKLGGSGWTPTRYTEYQKVKR